MLYERGQAEKIRREAMVMISALIEREKDRPCTHADLHFVIVVIVDCSCSHVKTTSIHFAPKCETLSVAALS